MSAEDSRFSQSQTAVSRVSTSLAETAGSNYSPWQLPEFAASALTSCKVPNKTCAKAGKFFWKRMRAYLLRLSGYGSVGLRVGSALCSSTGLSVSPPNLSYSLTRSPSHRLNHALSHTLSQSITQSLSLILSLACYLAVSLSPSPLPLAHSVFASWARPKTCRSFVTFWVVTTRAFARTSLRRRP